MKIIKRFFYTLIVNLFFINLHAMNASKSPEPVKNAPKFEEVFVEVKGAKIFCRVTGKGNPIIVIHGGPGLSQDYLLPNMAKLGENNFVIFYDQRCCGLSTGTVDENAISNETFFSDIESIRKKFGLKKINIIGHSWGGYKAMQYAIEYPHNLDKLILLNTCPASYEDYQIVYNEWVKRMLPYQGEIKAIEISPEFAKADLKTIHKYSNILFAPYLYDQKKVNLLNFYVSSESFINGNKIMELFEKDILANPYNLFEDLKKLKISTLIIHGDHDIVPLETVQRIHNSIKNSELIVLKNCGHFPYVEEPDVFFIYLNKFLQK